MRPERRKTWASHQVEAPMSGNDSARSAAAMARSEAIQASSCSSTLCRVALVML
jgi:hypothetical protein